jgi:predicted hotdog family 3-hydroxylacyl-ACP dehydratase
MSADIERLLPQRGTMRLLDRIVSWDAESCVAEWTVPADSPWTRDGRLARGAFLEIAAQAAAAHAGLGGAVLDARGRGGLLAAVPTFRFLADAVPGDVLVATVRRVADFGVLARFDCRIERGGALLAEGALTVARG